MPRALLSTAGCTASTLERRPIMSDAPIFILGTNRSGTTLLRLMLNAHSRIAVPEEMLYFRSDYAGVPVERWQAPGLSDAAYEELARSFVQNAEALHPELGTLRLIERIMHDGPRDLRYPYEMIMSTWANLQGKPRWGEKTPGNLFYVDVIYDMFPDAQFIYIARDPRAGVASMQRAEFFPEDIVFNALSRHKHFSTARRLLREHVPPAQWMEMRYEDLVIAPTAALEQVCAFLNEPFESGMLAYHHTAADYMKDEAATGFNAAATRPVSTSRLEDWRSRLTPEDVAVVESICFPEMEAFEYSLDNHSMSWSRRIQKACKTAYWHWKLWRHSSTRHYTVKYEMLASTRRRWRRWRNRLSYAPMH